MLSFLLSFIPSLLPASLLFYFLPFILIFFCKLHFLPIISVFNSFVFPSRSFPFLLHSLGIFPVFPHSLSPLTLSCSPSLPPSLFYLTISLHLLLGQSDQLSNFTWPGVVRADGQLPAAASRCPVITSNRVLLHKALLFSHCPIFFALFSTCTGGLFFLSWSACFFPSSSPPPNQ